jgi:cell division protein FtsI (penicillin-binding protein 3)
LRKQRFTIRPRLIVLMVLFSMFGLVLVGRLAFIQIGQHTDLASKAEAEHWQEDKIIPRRGVITDHNGHVLASNVSADSVYAVPAEIKDPSGLAGILSGMLGEPSDKIYGLISTNKANWVLLKSRLDPEISMQLQEMDLTGVYLDYGTKRVYPSGVFAAHVLGFANFENQGSYGVEGQYDSVVGGQPGIMIAERDSAGNPIGIGPWQWKPPVEGSDLVLSIDSSIQYMVERRLSDSVKEHKASGGSAIVMDPKTGAILAMASYPTYDPNRFTQIDQNLFLNPAISQLYEPGSTFKIVTMAAGLDTGTVTPNTTFQCAGMLTVHGYTIYNWDHNAHGTETMTQVLQHSCNIGSSFVSTSLGTEKFYKYVDDFGFGKATGVDLQGEEKGIIKHPTDANSNWTPIDLYTNSFGQGLSATPLQVISAAATIANGGKMMKPYIVERVERDGKVTQETKPETIRQVIKPETAKTLTQMLLDSVSDGEARQAGVKGYLVAAKTGTAQIPDANGYDSTSTIGSTVSYFPAWDPRWVVLVKIDHPQDTPWGSQTAAPAAQAIAQDILMHFRVPPTEPVDASK